MRTLVVCFAAGLLLGLTGCQPARTAQEPIPRPESLATPDAPGSAQPNLTVAPDGRVYLSWIERAEEGPARLRYAASTDTGWTAASTIAEGDDWFVNWADFPSMAALDDGRLAAHLLAKSGSGTYAYDVQVLQTAADGATWQPPTVPHDDGTQTEHGFVSMVSQPNGQLQVVWLDGRHTGGGHASGDGDAGHGGGAMTLRTALMAADGSLTDEAELDARTCDCCQTAAVAIPGGVLVAYRDRSESEVRDISVVRRVDGAWSEPKPLHADGWTIAGCPVNGPSLAASGGDVAAAWFTMAEDTARVQIAFSDDAGASFGAPVRVDEGAPLGRVDVVMLPDGDALVVWMASAEEGARIRARRVGPAGTLGTPFTLAETKGARSSGFPRIVRTGDELVAAWVDVPAERIRTARLSVRSIPPAS